LSRLLCFFFQAEDGIRVFHVTGVQTCALPISAVAKVRAYSQNRLPVEVECETLTQVSEAVAAGVEIIMLDNMAPAMMGQAVELRSEERRVGKERRSRSAWHMS